MKFYSKQTIAIVILGMLTVAASLGWIHKSNVVPDDVIRNAINRSIPELENSCNVFIIKKHCSSCHHGSLTSMVAELAKQKGITVEDSFVRNRSHANSLNGTVCNPNDVHSFLNIKLIAPYLLLGMYADKTPADRNTDIMVAFIMSEINPDGSFPGEFLRAPLEVGQIHVTSLCIRAIQLYASPALKPKVDKMVNSTRSWLEKTTADTQQELVFQILGLNWCGGNSDKKLQIINKLLDMQRADGGWAQLPSMQSDAYATGQALYALFESGMIQKSDEKIQRAIQYLLKTQLKSGVWFVEARSYIIQPFVNTDFPINDENQFISASATSWATLALLKSLPDTQN